MDNFNFVLCDLDMPVLYISHSGLSFNKYCIEKLGNPEFVNIGLDKANKKLAIKNAENSKGFLCRYTLRINGQNISMMYINSAKLKTEITKIVGVLPHQKPLGYIAEFDAQKNMLIVDLTKSIN